MLRITLKSHSTICIFTRSHKKMWVSYVRGTPTMSQIGSLIYENSHLHRVMIRMYAWLRRRVSFCLVVMCRHWGETCDRCNGIPRWKTLPVSSCPLVALYCKLWIQCIKSTHKGIGPPCNVMRTVWLYNVYAIYFAGFLFSRISRVGCYSRIYQHTKINLPPIPMPHATCVRNTR